MKPISETARLLIRELSLRDVPALSEILGDPEVMKHSVRGEYDEAATRRFIAWCLACYQSHGYGPWALIDKGSSTLVGFCGIGPECIGDKEETNLGYRLARRYWGQGLATESVQAVLDYAFEAQICSSMVVIVEPQHIASLRVAEKAGFQRFEETEFHGKPVRLYRMTQGAWRNTQSR